MSYERPIAQRTTISSHGFDQGEHGAGIGASGGLEAESTHPIADKFMSEPQQSEYAAPPTGQAPYAQGVSGAFDSNPSTQSQGHPHHHHHHHHHQGQGGAVGAGETPLSYGAAGVLDNQSYSLGQPVGDSGVSGGYQGGSSNNGLTGDSAVSGAYEGGGFNNALTGESHAFQTRAGVGPLGENRQTAGAAALAGTAVGAGAAAGAEHAYGTGVRPAGGAGGHYSAPEEDAIGGHGPVAARVTGAAVTYDGDAGGKGTRKGHYGTVDNDPSRGDPISDPKDLDSGGRHGLVFQESTGKYVHRHALEE